MHGFINFTITFCLKESKNEKKERKVLKIYEKTKNRFFLRWKYLTKDTYKKYLKYGYTRHSYLKKEFWKSSSVEYVC